MGVYRWVGLVCGMCVGGSGVCRWVECAEWWGVNVGVWGCIGGWGGCVGGWGECRWVG